MYANLSNKLSLVSDSLTWKHGTMFKPLSFLPN